MSDPALVPYIARVITGYREHIAHTGQALGHAALFLEVVKGRPTQERDRVRAGLSAKELEEAQRHLADANRALERAHRIWGAKTIGDLIQIDDETGRD